MEFSSHSTPFAGILGAMNQHFFEFFRCPENGIRFDVTAGLSAAPGYFGFGGDLTCYGKTSAVQVARDCSSNLRDALPAVCMTDDEIKLPFDPDQVVDNLRYERYTCGGKDEASRLGAHPVVR